MLQNLKNQTKSNVLFFLNLPDGLLRKTTLLEDLSGILFHDPPAGVHLLYDAVSLYLQR